MRGGHYADAYRLLRTSTLPDADEWRRLCEEQASDPLANNHWEFLAIALLHRHDWRGVLAEELHERLEKMQPFWHERHESMNFRLMRAVAEARLACRLIGRRDLEAINLKQRHDGALPDGCEGLSTQYHAYMLLLLLRWGDQRDAALRNMIEEGFAWLGKVYDTWGDPSPLGRGRFQLFGYAALAAACHLSETWDLPQPEDYIAHIHDRLDPEQPDGALSVRWTGPYREALLHGYNTPDDYRAFADFWTTDIRRRRLRGVPTILARYPLDYSGASLIADGNGPVFSLMPSPNAPPEDIGYNREARQMLRVLFRRPRYAENLPPERLADRSFTIKGARFHCEGQSLTMETPSVACWHSPIVWTLKGAGAPECHGVMEMATWEWSRSGAEVWIGYSFRVFRSAKVTWTLR